VNLYTILGVACADEIFAALLFTDSYAAVQSLGITLTQLEFDQLNMTLSAGIGAGLPEAFAGVRGKICPPGQVCPWMIGKPGGQGCGSGQSQAAD